MHIGDLDLNLLRLFDAVYRTRNVSRAAQLLGLSQPATSHGLTRLRLLLKDPLFVRVAGGVRATPRADRLAQGLQPALAAVERAFSETERFAPGESRLTVRLHLSDIGEGRFLPELLRTLHHEAPGVRVSSRPWPHDEIAMALDGGTLDFAIGFLPSVLDTQRVPLISDRYVILLREAHPAALQRATTAQLRRMEFVAVRSHSETLRILQALQLEDRVRLTASHFLALPSVVRSSDLAALMPKEIAQGFAAQGGLRYIEPRLPLQDFTVSLHWSRRFERDPAHRWMRELVCRLFKTLPD
ncbi:LysR family transcriptional regulator [Schlegelella sp. S2-27]|uniref:LysR family transcriptional regulator n=1 Tax=Caldimonas mangrovi TaxID=2944811 RepID=A0ABT0YPX4_9BURK|nr:LysR family transcriptional regulator [Caldimonas mangrovi]MCM5680459.1 LysR family transcriptional regulator [Caldimonas mangrovi]